MNSSIIQIDTRIHDHCLNLVLQYQYDNTAWFKRFRIDLSRDGIRSIEEVR